MMHYRYFFLAGESGSLNIMPWHEGADPRGFEGAQGIDVLCHDEKMAMTMALARYLNLERVRKGERPLFEVVHQEFLPNL